jgi:hypothetical protein
MCPAFLIIHVQEQMAVFLHPSHSCTSCFNHKIEAENKDINVVLEIQQHLQHVRTV